MTVTAPAGPAGDRTDALAAWVAGLEFADLEQGDLDQLAILLLDHLGCVVRGATLPWGEALTRWAADYRDTGRSLIIGTSARTSAPIAALLNATAAHGMEFDDTHDESLTHPGAGVIATALAIAEETDSPGTSVLAAIVAGYEVTARVGIATGASILERGFHPTALFGGFGAAAAAAKLYGLTARELVSAWGLLLSMTGGSMQFAEDPSGTTVKRLHGGYGAMHGALAAQWVRYGIAGPTGAIDGRYGLARLFGSDDSDVEALTRPSRRRLAVHDISQKPYPCCRLFHSTIDALREAVGTLPADPATVRGLTIGAPAVVPAQHMMRRPASMMAAQYSLPYVMGVALVHGPYDDAPYTPARLRDEAVLAVADRVDCIVDDAMQAAFPDHFGSWVEVDDAVRGRVRVERLDSYGTPAAPMTSADVAAKVDALLAAAAIDVSAKCLSDEIERLAAGHPVAALMARLSRVGN